MKIVLYALISTLTFIICPYWVNAQKTNFNKMEKSNSKTIVFIHGLFMNPNSWGPWMKYFEAKGYKCYAPAYPYHDGRPMDLRINIDPELGRLNLGQVINSLSAFIDQLPEEPILIGHSMGALTVQKLLVNGKGCAGICIDSAPPKGIFSFHWSFLKANLPVINPFKGNSVFIPSLNWFHYAFCNMMSLDETKIEFDKFVVPESRNIVRSSTKNEGKIDFKKPHKPLLFVAGEKDHIIPASLNKKNFRAYKDKNSKKSFIEFQGRTHYICGQQGWEEVAKSIYEWIITVE